MLPGSGIGPELMGYIKEVFKYAGAPVDFELIDIDAETDDNTDLDYAITSIRRNGVAIKGNIETKSKSATVLSRNVAIRNELDLYVNVLHCKSYPGIPARQKNIDIVIIRQNTEGEYAMLEHEVRSTLIYYFYISMINKKKSDVSFVLRCDLAKMWIIFQLIYLLAIVFFLINIHPTKLLPITNNIRNTNLCAITGLL